MGADGQIHKPADLWMSVSEIDGFLDALRGIGAFRGRSPTLH
jgi:hypothetical protein